MLDQAIRRLFLVFSYRLFAVSLINTRLIIQAKISFFLSMSLARSAEKNIFCPNICHKPILQLRKIKRCEANLLAFKVLEQVNTCALISKTAILCYLSNPSRSQRPASPGLFLRTLAAS